MKNVEDQNTSDLPKDLYGRSINLFDIVKLLRVPDYLMVDADTQELKDAYKEYEGCYGLVKYTDYAGVDGWPYWHGEDKLVVVSVVKLKSEYATSFEFFVPSDFVEKIPFNVLIMSVLSDLNWQVHWRAISNDTASDSATPEIKTFFPVMSNTEQYKNIKMIYETSYENLVRAHKVAIESIITP